MVAAGETLLAPSVTTRIAEFVRRPSSLPVPGLDPVTGRERQVLTLIAQGLSNAEICDRLQLSVGTVKTHVGRLLAALHARPSRSRSAAMMARQARFPLWIR